MRRVIPLTSICLLVLCFSALTLVSACNTTAGAGRDISKVGHAITNSATEHSY